MTGERAPRQLAAVSADLLDQGAIIDRLSRPLTIAALIGLIVGLGIELGALLVSRTAVGEPRGSRRDISCDPRRASTRSCSAGWPKARLLARPTLGRLDAALIELGVLTESKA